MNAQTAFLPVLMALVLIALCHVTLMVRVKIRMVPTCACVILDTLALDKTVSVRDKFEFFMIYANE